MSYFANILAIHLALAPVPPSKPSPGPQNLPLLRFLAQLPASDLQERAYQASKSWNLRANNCWMGLIGLKQQPRPTETELITACGPYSRRGTASQIMSYITQEGHYDLQQTLTGSSSVRHPTAQLPPRSKLVGALPQSRRSHHHGAVRHSAGRGAGRT